MEFKNVPEKHVFENINFGSLQIMVLIALASNEGSDETLQCTVSSNPSLFTYTRMDVHVADHSEQKLELYLHWIAKHASFKSMHIYRFR